MKLIIKSLLTWNSTMNYLTEKLNAQHRHIRKIYSTQNKTSFH